MDFISEYFYIILIIVGAIAQWLKARQEDAGETSRQSGEEGYHPESLGDAKEVEEQVNPRPAVPPPLPTVGEASPGGDPAAVRGARGKVPPARVSEDVRQGAAEEMARQQSLIDRAREFKDAKRSRLSTEKRPRHENVAIPAPGSGLRSRLDSRREIRRALVLKEVLDKPVALR